MSAIRLRQPKSIGSQGCKWLGTSIVTTLAALPHGNGANFSEPKPSDEAESPVQQPNSLYNTIHNVLTDTDPTHPSEKSKLLTNGDDEGACGGDIKARPLAEDAMKAPVTDPQLDDSQDRYINVENIFADFNGSDIPSLARPETWVHKPDVAAVQRILEAYERGELVEDLIRSKFPKGDFKYHLAAYLRQRMEGYKRCREGSIEIRLMDAYLTGVKEWCAAALDIFISQVEQHLCTSEATDGQQGGGLAPWHPRFLEQAASEQKGSFDLLFYIASKDDPKFYEEWRQYKRGHKLTHHTIPTSMMPAAKSRRMLLRKRLYFFRWLLRRSSPRLFKAYDTLLARAIKSLGGPCFLMNLIQSLSLYPDDVVEYERLKKSVQGVVDSDLQEVSTPIMNLPVDLPKSVEHLSYPLSVLDSTKVAAAFSRHELPPFLQVGYELEVFKTEAINKIVELYHCGEHDKALSVMDQEFSEAEEFHAHLFGLLRQAMRSYALVPKTSKGYNELKASYPQEFSTPLRDLLHVYITGLQSWCADVHGAQVRHSENIIHDAYGWSQEGWDRFIDEVMGKEPYYTACVKWVQTLIDPTSMKAIVPPPEISLELNPQVASLRESLYAVNSMLRHLPWDYFLFLRASIATVVRSSVIAPKTFSFLANVLQSLSFTNRDVDGFRLYYPLQCGVVSKESEKIQSKS
eukprot:Blabericola_migrator_1__3500@NODE_2038_length_3381_cov_22_297224_g1273_i1_p1_GENE_NODE_2038_length_3381_cov_22_297224_g1273_i1NODE_2038_length_3381_cov_22_297224_g1273_i1_p1_ORF_typecomplete_len687_score105_83_NODE_2038_length_3381_cov_22_297224_g1273_i112713331